MLMRSKLFVPGSRPELFTKAAASAADALSFDLEDAVAPGRKAEARGLLSRFLQAPPVPLRQTIVVRVNAVGTEHFTADLEAVCGPVLHLINLPMVEDPAAVIEAAEALARMAPQVRLLINIETAKGLRLAASLAGAHPSVAGLQVGYADLMEPLGMDRMDPAAIAHIRLAVRLAAAEAGVAAYDGAYANVGDPEGYRAECEAARRHGFAGKSCIHPTQISIANAAFLPKPVEVDRARRTLMAAAEAEAKGVGAYLVDGRMVDAPFVASARAIVALADAAAQERAGAKD